MKTWTVTKDGTEVFRVESEHGYEVLGYLHSVQPQSAWWAQRFLGYVIYEDGKKVVM